MSKLVVSCKLDDRVSSLLAVLSGLIIKVGAELPPLPETMIDVVGRVRGGTLVMQLPPSADMAQWVSDVIRIVGEANEGSLGPS